MPPTANLTGTDGTQFIQLILPLEIDDASIFDPSQPQAHLVDYLDPDALVIEDEAGNHVHALVLVNGVDVLGQGPATYLNDPEWTQLKGANIAPGPGKTSILFIAQPSPGITGDVPRYTPFSLWTGHREIRIRLNKVDDLKGNTIQLNSRWFVLKEGAVPPRVAQGDEDRGPGQRAGQLRASGDRSGRRI